MFESKNNSVFKESAVTLRNPKSKVYTFSRADRFRSQSRPVGSEFVSLPSTLIQRGPSQGYGKRWSPELRTVSPAPNSYNIPSTFTVGLGGYRKDSPVKPTPFVSCTPGPGAYDLPPVIGRDSPRFTFRPKIDIRRYIQSPSPNAYLVKLNETYAFKKISFGVGEKGLNLTAKQTPGPGTYDLPSFFLKTKV